MDFDIWAGHPNLLDEEAHELLTLLEIEGVEAVPHAIGEGVDAVRQVVIDGQRFVLGHEFLALLLKLAMALHYLAVSRLELREFDSLHLIQVDDSSSLPVRLLQPTVQPFQLGIQQLVIGRSCACAQGRFAFH